VAGVALVASILIGFSKARPLPAENWLYCWNFIRLHNPWRQKLPRQTV